MITKHVGISHVPLQHIHASDLHFHDLRGTAATRFYTADLRVRIIAEIMGWEEEHVEKILRRYVGRTAATKAIIAQLNQTGRGT